MSSNISQRDAFFNRLYEIAKADKNVVIVAADMAAPSLDEFRVNLPNQFINVGIAEQNAILIGSGLALVGKNVFTYAIASFITLRCLDQIRVNNGIMNIPITIVGMGTGFTYETDGPTHHLIEDIAIMRAMPNIRINNITDNVMASAYADISYRKIQTNYIRLDKDLSNPIYDKNFDFSKGLSKVKDGNEYLLVSTGIMTHTALEVSSCFQNIDIGVIDIFELPLNEKLFIDMVKGAKKIITLEEHFLPGGLGSAVCEVLADNGLMIPVKRLGMDVQKGYCYKYGGRDIIRGFYGLDKETLKQVIGEYIKI
jgi:transketolase